MTIPLAVHPKRIVYVWDADYPWDVRTEKTCLALTQAGHDVHIVARNRQWRPELERLPEGTVHRMPIWRWAGQKYDGLLSFPAFFSPRWRALLARTMHSVRAELVIVRDLPLCPTAISVSRKFGVPVILDMAEHYPAIMREIWTSGRQRPLDYVIRNPNHVERVERYCISRASHILTVVEESSDRLIKLGVPEDRLTVVGNTPPLTRATAVAPKAPAPVGAPVDVVYLGLLEVSRGINELIDAIAQLRHEPTQFRLRIIGNGRDESIFRARAASHGLSTSHVEFLGYQPYDVAMNIVASADIGALPLHMNEHMNTTVPNKLFDYMSVGLPVITSDTHAAARIVSSTGSGVIFRAKDAEDLAVQLKKLADPTVRSAMGMAGYQAILKDYHWELDAGRLLDAIRRCGRTLGNGQLEPPP